MSTIKVKVVGYDEASNALLVSYASSETQSQNPDDYPPVAVQVNGTDDIEKIKHHVALIGTSVVQAQVNRERLANNENKVNEIKDLVGKEFSYAESDLGTSADGFANEVSL